MASGHVELPEHGEERVAHPGQRVVSLVEHEPGRGRSDVVLAGSGRLRLERR